MVVPELDACYVQGLISFVCHAVCFRRARSELFTFDTQNKTTYTQSTHNGWLMAMS